MRVKKEHFIKKRNFYIARFVDALAFPITLFFNKQEKGGPLEFPKKILLIGNHHVGDLLFITPLLAALRSEFAGAKIYLACPENYRDILGNNPNLDGYINCGESVSGIIHKCVEVMKAAAVIRKEEFDMGMSYNNNHFALYHIMLFLSGVRRRIGYGHKGLSFLLTDVVDYKGPKILVEARLDFARYLGSNAEFKGVEIYLSDSEIDEGEAAIAGLGLSPGAPVIGISPHAEHPFLWNDYDWIELCMKLRTKYNAEIVFVGSPAAAGIVEDIRNGLDFISHSLAGKTNVRQAAALIRKFDLLVSIDTGTRHIAAAEGTPVVFLWQGSDNDLELGPYVRDHFMVKNRVSCAPCGDYKCKYNTYACVKAIPVTAVFDIINDKAGSWMPVGPA